MPPGECTTGVTRIDFLRTKYGREILVDAAYTSRLVEFDRAGAPHALTFFDILLVTRGRGLFVLDGVAHPVRPGVVFFTRPGEVREWRATGVNGACLFFAAEFVGEAFSDPRFLDAFGFFAAHRPSSTLTLTRTQRSTFLSRFVEMEREIRTAGADTPHLLRAVLYELLVVLNRWYVAAFGPTPRPPAHSVVDRFTGMVEREFRQRQRVGDYAQALGLTPGHLSALCRLQCGQSASACIRGRIVLEARRLLRYGDHPASAVAYALGFEDPSYFTRFFRRETGMTPSAYRAASGAVLARTGPPLTAASREADRCRGRS